MSTLNCIHYKSAEAAERIQLLYKRSELTPFLGAGFTKDCKSYRGTVPDAARLMQGIKDICIQNSPDDTTKKQISDISKLKVAFSMLKRPSLFPVTSATRYFESLFSRVKLTQEKKDLIDLDWPNIFSFNVDDAIEEYTSKFFKVLPNKPISYESILAKKCLFKIHGDITEYCTHPDTKLIFTWHEYTESIHTNKAMLTYLGNLAKNGSLLFIGCSLDEEIDLQLLSHTYSFANSIFLKKGVPSLTEELTLESYGINTVIYFDDYHEIYSWLRNTLASTQIESRIKNLRLIETPEAEVLKHIANGGPIVRNNDEEIEASIPGCLVTRTAFINAKRQLVGNSISIITGRRFAGKTNLLLQIYSELKEFNVYFFPSTSTYNKTIERALLQSRDTIFLFDSNSITHNNLWEILGLAIHSSNRVIIVVAKSDLENFKNIFDRRAQGYFELILPHGLNHDETTKFNINLNSLGLPTVNKGESLLDFSYRVHTEFKGEIGFSAIFEKSLDEHALKIALLCAAFEKATSSQVYAINEYLDPKEFVQKYEILFDLESDRTDSGQLIFSNSKSWLINNIRDIAKEAPQKIVHTTIELVKSLYHKGLKDTANVIIRFDKLNDIFARDQYGAATIIRSIYNGLSDTYGDSSHYWLQMAKCELMAGKTVAEVDSGIRYAKKVRLDNADRKVDSYYSATLILAQLYGRKYDMTQQSPFLPEMLENYLESFDNQSNNQSYIAKIVKKYKRGGDNVIYRSLTALFDSTDEVGLLNRDRINKLKAYVNA